jgi:hypothetical protein
MLFDGKPQVARFIPSEEHGLGANDSSVARFLTDEAVQTSPF